jgi:hypothetical protein
VSVRKVSAQDEADATHLLQVPRKEVRHAPLTFDAVRRVLPLLNLHRAGHPAVVGAQLGDRHNQLCILEARLHVGLVQFRGQVEAALKPAHAALCHDERSVTLLLHVTAHTRDADGRRALRVDADVFLLHLRQVGDEGVAVVLLGDVHRRDPLPTRARGEESVVHVGAMRKVKEGKRKGEGVTGPQRGVHVVVVVATFRHLSPIELTRSLPPLRVWNCLKGLESA